MFCQCQEAGQGQGCTGTRRVWQAAADPRLMDVLFHAVRGEAIRTVVLQKRKGALDDRGQPSDDQMVRCSVID